jgi:hypothetical protein
MDLSRCGKIGTNRQDVPHPLTRRFADEAGLPSTFRTRLCKSCPLPSVRVLVGIRFSSYGCSLGMAKSRGHSVDKRVMVHEKYHTGSQIMVVSKTLNGRVFSEVYEENLSPSPEKTFVIITFPGTKRESICLNVIYIGGGLTRNLQQQLPVFLYHARRRLLFARYRTRRQRLPPASVFVADALSVRLCWSQPP